MTPALIVDALVLASVATTFTRGIVTDLKVRRLEKQRSVDRLWLDYQRAEIEKLKRGN